jgi:hypothetical protein
LSVLKRRNPRLSEWDNGRLCNVLELLATPRELGMSKIADASRPLHKRHR